MAEKYKGNANPEYIAAMREIRRSSAASPHKDARTKRARTRQASLRRDLKDES